MEVKEVNLRATEEVAKRVVVLAFTNLVAFNDISAELAVEEIKKYDLWGSVSPKEEQFLKYPSEESKNYETWKCEAIWVLMWALHIVDELGLPNEVVNLKSIPYEVYPIGAHKDPRVFINSNLRIRNKEEILKASEWYTQMDKACIAAEDKGSILKEVHPRVVYERNCTLNWLLSYQNCEWDTADCKV